MKNAVTRTLDLQRETIRKIANIVLEDYKTGDHEKVAAVIAILCEHEILYDQIMESR